MNDWHVVKGERKVKSISLVLMLFIFAVFCFPPDIAKASQEVRLFVIEKSKNPQNILVVYSNVNADCEIQSIADAGRDHLFDFYWLMNRTVFKPTHQLIKKQARKRFPSQDVSDNGRHFEVILTDLRELVHDLPSDIINIDIRRDRTGQCRARVLLPLGPSAKNRTLAIRSIYSKAKTFLGIPIGVHYVELRGVDADSKEILIVRFSSSGK